jgi:radical SAM superfamily enzyme YgiQ (UPF0313 family)
MRVLLVNPPRSSRNLIRFHAPSEVRPYVHEKLIGPPLGLTALAGNLPRHDVEILDLKAEIDLAPSGDTMAILGSALQRFRPDLVGVTVLASEFPAACRILAETKAFDASTVTAVGGVHPTAQPGDFEGSCADLVFLSQAKKTFRDALDRLEAGQSLEGLPNMARQQDGKLSFHPRLDVLIRPDHLLDDVHPAHNLLARYDAAYRVKVDSRPFAFIYTSLGCPGRCTFCSIWPQMGRRYHQRSAESVVAELETLEQPVVRFADANTFGDEKAAAEIFDLIVARGVKKDLVMDMRADTAATRPDLVEKAARAGLKVVICGFESDSLSELKAFRKETDPGQVAAAIEVYHRFGIRVRGNYMVQAHFTEHEFARMEGFAARHPVSFAGFTVATPMPGTPYHVSVRDRIVRHDLSYYNFFNSVLPTALPEEEFYERVARLWTVKLGNDVI